MVVANRYFPCSLSRISILILQPFLFRFHSFFDFDNNVQPYEKCYALSTLLNSINLPFFFFPFLRFCFVAVKIEKAINWNERRENVSTRPGADRRNEWEEKKRERMKWNSTYVYETINGGHAIKHFKFSNKHANEWQHKRHLFYRPEYQEPTKEPRKYYATQMNDVSNLENEKEEEKKREKISKIRGWNINFTHCSVYACTQRHANLCAYSWCHDVNVCVCICEYRKLIIM